MGMLHNGHHEWLRSPVGPYLHADEDGRGVSLHPRRASQNAACAVHLFHSDGLYVLPHGSCGRYLAAAASASAAPTGHRGVQLDFDQAEVEAIMWQVVMSETGDDVLLRHVSGRFLSAIGRYQWHNGSIVDNSTMVVEAIPRRQAMPSLPGSPLVVAFPFLVKGYLNWYGTSRDANEKLKDSNTPVIGMVLQRSHIVTGRGRIIPGRLPRCRSLTCHTSSSCRSCSRRQRSGLTSPLVCTRFRWRCRLRSRSLTAGWSPSCSPTATREQGSHMHCTRGWNSASLEQSGGQN